MKALADHEVYEADRFKSVSSVSWLENDLFLVGYTAPSSGMAEPTDFFLVSRQKGTSNFTFQKTPEICPPFGMDRSPPHYFTQRLRNFPPNLEDVIIFSSTAAVDTSILAKSKTPLSSDLDASEITDVFTMTTITDSKRAILPMDAAMSDTSPIGMVLDLTSREKVKRPLPGEEMDESAGPLPTLLILNNEGVLSAWWFVYAESVRQGTTYPELSSQRSQDPVNPKAAATAAAPSVPAFGQSSLTSPMNHTAAITPFAKQPTSASAPFGAPPQSSSSGTFSTSGNDTKPLFGGSGGGPQSSPWSSGTAGPGSAPGAAFGSTSTLGGSTQTTAFGTSGGLGNKGSVWGTPSSLSQAQGGGSVFGQSSGLLGMRAGQPPQNNSSPFGSGSKSTGGGFSSFASTGGFMAAGGSGQSLFKTPAAGNTFGSPTEKNAFSGLADIPKEASTGPSSGGGFKLGSTFKSDGTAKDDLPKPKNDSSSFFGGSFGETLQSSQKDEQPDVHDDEMKEESDDVINASSEDESSKSPATPQSKVDDRKPLPSVTPLSGGMFGTKAQSSTTLAAVETSTPAKTEAESTTPEETPHRRIETPSASPSASNDSSELTPIKDEAEDETSHTPVSKTLQPPLPPESTSKTSYAAGESSGSSKASSDEAPLPPDFLPSKSKLSTTLRPPEQASLPNDENDEGPDDEGSGVDVAQDLSPTEPSDTPGITPGSTFTGSFERTPLGEKFINVRKQDPRPKASTLFGELTESTTPSLPPPSKPRTFLSPRSPSPIRQEIPQQAMLDVENIRPASQRSISTPARPSELFAPRRPRRLPQPTSQEPEVQEEDGEQQEHSDEEDEKVRKRLDSDIIPSKILPELEVHKDYVGKVTKPGIPGQIDRVERDISSMVDVLGLNARSLKSWTMAQEAQTLHDDANMDDLVSIDANEATLDDLYPISDILADLSTTLEENRLQDPLSILRFTHSASLSLSQAIDQRPSLQRAIISHADPDASTSHFSTSLPHEQSLALRELRSKITAYQTQLSKTESEIVNLRTQLAISTGNGIMPAGQKRPTVEAVMNTIRKMTAMVERRSGDVDVLEYRMRKLGYDTTGGAAPPRVTTTDEDHAQGLENPREATPTTALQHGMQSMTLDPATAYGQNKAQKKPTFTKEEIENFTQRRRRRKDMRAAVADVLIKTGPRLTGLG